MAYLSIRHDPDKKFMLPQEWCHHSGWREAEPEVVAPLQGLEQGIGMNIRERRLLFTHPFPFFGAFECWLHFFYKRICIEVNIFLSALLD